MLKENSQTISNFLQILTQEKGKKQNHLIAKNYSINMAKTT